MATTLKWIEPHSIKARSYRSRYSKDGSYVREFPAVRTVGELREAIEGLPDNLPLNVGSEEATLVWFNVGLKDEHLSIEDAEVWADEDDDD